MLRSLLPVAVFAFAIPVSPPRCDLRACRCIPASALGQSAAEFVRARKDRAERVVLGTVIRLDTLARVAWGSGPDAVALRPIVARVRVRRVWRGSLADTMTVMVTTLESRSSCDLELLPGEAYLIFATRTEGGPLATHQCSGTVEEHAAADAIAVLGAGQDSRPNEP
jgi:hypothetical protein